MLSNMNTKTTKKHLPIIYNVDIYQNNSKSVSPTFSRNLELFHKIRNEITNKRIPI